MGKSSIHGPFSMAMLNNQRVYYPPFLPQVLRSRAARLLIPRLRDPLLGQILGHPLHQHRLLGRHLGDVLGFTGAKKGVKSKNWGIYGDLWWFLWWFMVIYGDLWCFMMFLWWFVVIYGVFMVICGDLWWFLWWFMVICGDITSKNCDFSIQTWWFHHPTCWWYLHCLGLGACSIQPSAVVEQDRQIGSIRMEDWNQKYKYIWTVFGMMPIICIYIYIMYD